MKFGDMFKDVGKRVDFGGGKCLMIVAGNNMKLPIEYMFRYYLTLNKTNNNNLQ